MNKKTIAFSLSAVLVFSLLTSCDLGVKISSVSGSVSGSTSGSSSEASSSDKDSSSLISSTPISSSDSSLASSSSGDTTTEIDMAFENIGDYAKLKTTVNKAMTEKGITGVTGTEKNGYWTEGNNLTYSITKKGVNVVSEGKTDSTQFLGIIDSENVYYSLDNYATIASGTFSRKKIVQEENYAYTDQITEEAALDEINYIKDKALTKNSALGFFNLSSSKYTFSDNYKYISKTLTYQVSFNAYSESTDTYTGCHLYSVLLTLSKEFLLNSVVYTDAVYNPTDWQTDSHAPKDGTEATRTNRYTIDSITYEDVLETTSLPISATIKNTVFMNSISNPVIYSGYGQESQSEKNKPLEGAYLDIDLDVLSFSPAEAVDKDTISIIGTSDESVVSFKSRFNGWQVTEGTAGKTVTLTVGNSFISISVELTIQKAPNIANIDADNPSLAFVDSTKGTTKYLSSDWTYQIVMGSLNTDLVLKVKTTNKGPFEKTITAEDGLDTTILELKVVDQNLYYDAADETSYSYVYFSLNLKVNPVDIPEENSFRYVDMANGYTSYCSLFNYIGTDEWGNQNSMQFSFRVSLAA